MPVRMTGIFFGFFTTTIVWKGQRGGKAVFRDGAEASGYAAVFTEVTRFTDKKELAPTIVNKLIQRIEVHKPEKGAPAESVKADIYFTAVGLIRLPDEREIRKTAEQMRSTPQAFRQIPA